MPDLVTLTPDGLYCPLGDFYIDPWHPVERAVITHAHGDHARRGSRHYHGARSGVGLLRQRLGPEAIVEGHEFGDRLTFGETTVSFHPAGHVLGSAQIRIEAAGTVWVVSGDYKREPDPSCEPCEVVPCEVFITEATFALPIYRWEAVDQVLEALLGWWEGNAAAGRASVLFCYALGKAQRVLAEIGQRADRPVFVHGAIEALLDAYRHEGVALAPTVPVGPRRKGESFAGELIIAPPSAFGSPWLRRFGDSSTAFASGWMRVRGNRRRRGFDRGFVLSDHADWPALLRTIEQTGAKRVLATHGYSDALARYLREIGLAAEPLETWFGDEAEDADSDQIAVMKV
ncbi:MAG TPA: ligase-associated DNA damage response exonuclease [Geminicoccaceae bacterium]